MNDDDFLTRFRETPRPEFSDQLYRRINQPMNDTKSWSSQPAVRRLAFSLALLMFVLLATLSISPAARAFAGDVLRRVGAISLAPAAEDSALEPAPTVPAPAEQEAQQAASGAEAAALAGFPLQTPGYLPEGYVPSSDWSVAPLGEGVIVASGYRNGDHFLFFNAFLHGPDDLFDQGASPQEGLSEVTVRGQAGVWITNRLMAHPDAAGEEPALVPTTWLMWEEDGVNYTLFGDDLTRDEALRIAGSLAP